MFDRLFKFFSRDVGIDLGTANTLVYVRGRGIIINEPSIVAINKKTNQVLSVGVEAKKMVGRTPSHIVAVRPLIEGVISDFEVTEQMLRYFFNKVHKDSYSFLVRPRVVIGIPSGVTEVERRAVEDAARNAGAREVYLVEEPMAAAIGARLPISEAVGNMIVDIGGGTTDIAVISLGGIVASRNLRIAGDRMNEDIIQYVRDKFQLLLGEKSAEEIKILIGSVIPLKEQITAVVRGRDLISGLPKEIIINDSEIREALLSSTNAIISEIRDVVEETPPELVADLMTRGIILAGGGTLLRGLPELVSETVGIPTRLAEDPLTAVVRGCGIILEDVNALKEILVNS
ncbi:MAG: rod shape-determining protein [Candidatus Azambacteria bacterium]|nr:rod shape-determining protein [Candidatus Azambacteria bacterium]